MDINKVLLSGVVVTDPVYSKADTQVAFATFSLKVAESYIDREGTLKSIYSIVEVESVGKLASVVIDTISQGNRVVIDGYLRQNQNESKGRLKVRTFAVTPDRGESGVRYLEGLKEALRILASSNNLDTARQKINSLLKTS